MKPSTGNHFWNGWLACLAAALLLWSAGSAAGQTLGPARQAPARGMSGGEESLTAATDYNPDRVRNQLKAIHGFTRARLDAASTDVPQMLMAWIADPGESMLIRRQAVKALKLYPSGQTFTFIRDTLPGAPAPLQMLLLGALQAHAAQRPAEVAALAATYLEHSQVTVRQAAVSLAGALQGRPELNRKLQERLAEEPDPGVRKSIHRALKPN